MSNRDALDRLQCERPEPCIARITRIRPAKMNAASKGIAMGAGLAGGPVPQLEDSAGSAMEPATIVFPSGQPGRAGARPT